MSVDPSNLTPSSRDSGRSEVTSPLRVVFLCGHRSRYGAAHLDAIRRHFDLAGVVLGSDARWRTFAGALSGRPARSIEIKRPTSGLRHAVRSAIPSGLLLRRAARLGRPGHALDLCRHHRIPLMTTDDANDETTRAWIESHAPDLVISAAFPQILDRPLLELAPRGAVNFHPSALPAFRGAHPHYWAIAKGATTSGVTSHFMTEAIDRGNIVAQIEFPIATLNYTQLYDRIIEETDAIVAATAEFFRHGGGSGIPQDDSRATFYCNDRDADHEIRWDTHDAGEVMNLVRTERAWAHVGGHRLEVSAVEPVHHATTRRVSPGTVVSVDASGVVVAGRDGLVRITTFRIDGLAVDPLIAFAQAAMTREPEECHHGV